MNIRTKRIEELQNVILGLKGLAQPFLESISQAETELATLRNGFGDGERVRVTKTCKRGCCVEHEFEGTIEGTTPNGCYNVRCDDDGTLQTYIWSGDMKRI